MRLPYSPNSKVFCLLFKKVRCLLFYKKTRLVSPVFKQKDHPWFIINITQKFLPPFLQKSRLASPLHKQKDQPWFIINLAQKFFAHFFTKKCGFPRKSTANNTRGLPTSHGKGCLLRRNPPHRVRFPKKSPFRRTAFCRTCFLCLRQ